MKRIQLFYLLYFSICTVNAQNTAWSTTDNIGIGTSQPGVYKLAVSNGSGRFLFLSNSEGVGDIFKAYGKNGLNFSLNAFTPSTGSLKTSIGINYAIDGGGGVVGYNVAGNKKSPMILFDGDNGGIKIYGENGTGNDWRISNHQLGISVNKDGNVAIGMEETPQNYKFAVAGKAIMEEVKVKLQSTGWPDYVFKPGYKLRPISQIETYIKQHQHLEDVPSAATVEKEGVELGANQAVLLKKIEELTLHIIAQQKRIENLESKINQPKHKKLLKH